MAELNQEHESHRMGMHTEQLAGRTQQVFFSAEEEEGFTYPDAFEVDFNKRAEFDAADLPAPRPGWTRTVFLESHGWDKDADRNTGEGQQVEPLPFRAMTRYPYGPGESFPDTDIHRDYLENWLTRVVRPAPGALPRISP